MRQLTITLLATICFTINVMADNHGVPFFKNYTAKEYAAHNRNYDVACDDYGTLFVANFEGLLYYDGATWRKIHTPGISRVTRIAKGQNGRIWVGGYNVFGYLEAQKNGQLAIHAIVSDKQKNGLSEVDIIKCAGKDVFVHTTAGKTFKVVNDSHLQLLKNSDSNILTTSLDSINKLKLPDGATVTYKGNNGLQFLFGRGFHTDITTKDGLISDNINFITFDKRHTLWGATENGIFQMEVATPYSQVTENNGLKGEVYCINELGTTPYVGTLNGLFVINGNIINKVKDIDLACWQLSKTATGELLAATGNGLFVVTRAGLRRLSDASTLSVCYDPLSGQYIAGETYGISKIQANGKRTLISKIEKVTKISTSNGTITAETIYGEVWQLKPMTNGKYQATMLRKKASAGEPKISYTDCFNRLWETDSEGRGLTLKTQSKLTNTAMTWAYPLSQHTLNAVFVSRDGDIMAGGDFGLIIASYSLNLSYSTGEPERPYIREIIAMGDSVIWGGFQQNGLTPLQAVDGITLPSSCKNAVITFSTKTNSLVCPTQYRYRVNGGRWSAWSADNYVRFNNLMPGRMKLEIQALDLFGRESPVSTVEWYIQFPLYLRWWALLAYLIIIIAAIMAFFRWRTKRLEYEKEKLEGIVAERTAELSTALDDLKRTQKDLVRMERTATAGKLTQGLIDRILNPINYINNFSRLTTGLAKDLREDIDDEKENMSEDNYDDCQDILDMMSQNLGKIEEHGVSTTRTLRAMEAMLNNHIGTLTQHDITAACRLALNTAIEYHKDDIAAHGITINNMLPDADIMVKADADAINRVLLSIITNGIYAIVKKDEQRHYAGALTMKLTETDTDAVIVIEDNGIGIEDTIKEKVFDPFFTTKPTSEATGVGLYIARELIHDHKGTITLESEKSLFCRFTITLPKIITADNDEE